MKYFVGRELVFQDREIFSVAETWLTCFLLTGIFFVREIFSRSRIFHLPRIFYRSRISSSMDNCYLLTQNFIIDQECIFYWSQYWSAAFLYSTCFCQSTKRRSLNNASLKRCVIGGSTLFYLPNILEARTSEIFYQHEKINFVSPNGHVMFY